MDKQKNVFICLRFRFSQIDSFGWENKIGGNVETVLSLNININLSKAIFLFWNLKGATAIPAK